jgi:hypothetical protein
MTELESFLHRQSHIPKKTMKRLDVLAGSPNPEVARAAQVMTEVGKLYPYKRRRFKRMVRENRDLMRKLGEIGFILPFIEISHDELDEMGEPNSNDVIFGTDEKPWFIEDDGSGEDESQVPFDADDTPF